MKRAIDALIGSLPSRLNLAAKAALMHRDGRIVGITAPGAAPSMARSIDAVRQFFGASWTDGDVAVLNDPDRGATHVCQLTAVAAIYRAGAIDGWAALRANALDFGGWHPGGYSPQAVDRWAEGARFEPARILLADKARREVVDLLALNSRTPKATRHLALQLAHGALSLGRSESPRPWEERYAAELSQVRRRIGALPRQTAEGSVDIAVPQGAASPGRIAVTISPAEERLKILVAAPSVSARPVNLGQAMSEDIVATAVAASLDMAHFETGALASVLDVQIAPGMAAARLPACVGLGRETTGAALFNACAGALARLGGRDQAGTMAKQWLDQEVIGALDWASGRLGAPAVSALLATETEVPA